MTPRSLLRQLLIAYCAVCIFCCIWCAVLGDDDLDPNTALAAKFSANDATSSAGASSEKGLINGFLSRFAELKELVTGASANNAPNNYCSIAFIGRHARKLSCPRCHFA